MNKPERGTRTKWHHPENICFSFAPKQLLKFCRGCKKCISAFTLWTRQLSAPRQGSGRHSHLCAPPRLHRSSRSTTRGSPPPHPLRPPAKTKNKGVESLLGTAGGLRSSVEVTGRVYSTVSATNICLFGYRRCWVPNAIYSGAAGGWSWVDSLSKTGSRFLCSTSTLLTNPLNSDN